MTLALDADRADALAEQAEIRAELVAKANALVPTLRAHAAQGETDRRLADEVTDAIQSAGLFQACTPKRSGGGGGGCRALVEVSAELSRGDGSAGWVSFIANTTGFMTALLSDEVRAQLYENPRAIAISQFGPGARATEVEGGYRLTGEWPFASGSLQADWTLSGIGVVDENGDMKEARWALIPRKDLGLKDTWHVAGMKGTGSNTWTIDDVFVPADRTVDLPGFKGLALTQYTPDEPIYRAPIGTLACLGIVGPAMGLAEAAWDHVLEMVNSARPISAAYEDIRDAPSYRLALADARNLIDTGRFHLLHAADMVDEAAVQGRVLDDTARATIRGHAAAATKAFRDGVDLLLDIGGTRSFSLSNPLQRVWRDLEVATRHGLNNRLINREEYGLSLTGLEPAFPYVL